MSPHNLIYEVRYVLSIIGGLHNARITDKCMLKFDVYVHFFLRCCKSFINHHSQGTKKIIYTIKLVATLDGKKGAQLALNSII